jgi:hypothetical protein
MAELLIDFVTNLDGCAAAEGRIQLLEHVPKVLAERTGDAQPAPVGRDSRCAKKSDHQ